MKDPTKGYVTYITAIIAVALGIYLMTQEERETGLLFIVQGMGLIGVRRAIG